MKKFSIVLFFSLILSFGAQAQSLEVMVNRNPVPEGEAFVLSLTLHDGQTNQQPDVSALEKDFKVYSMSRSNNIQIINGKRSDTQQWDIGLISYKSGEVEIPALTVGKLSSQPIKMQIVSAGKAANAAVTAEAPKFSMKASINNPSPFVQQQLTYTLSILDAGGLQGAEPQFVMKNQNDWAIKALADPQVQTKNINGRNIREIQLRYALFPQKSGNLKTPLVHFEGFYLSKGKRGNDPFDGLFNDSFGGMGFGFSDMFAQRNPVVLTAEPIDVEVKPIPQENNGKWWLPAESVMLYSEWEPKNPVFKTGEAVTRTIYLKASGIAESQLPEIRFANSAKLKPYPEKPQTETMLENGNLVSVKKISTVYIPSEAGKTEIPAIEIPWFDVNNNQYQVANLPKISIDVLPGADVAKAPMAEQQTPVQAHATAQKTPPTKPEAAPSHLNLYLYTALAFVLGILLTYLWLRPKNITPNKPLQMKDYRKAILVAAEKKDLRQLRDLLIKWAEKKYPHKKIVRLSDIANITYNESFKNQMQLLMRNLYAEKADETWDAQVFIEEFERVCLQKEDDEDENNILPPLYNK